MRQLLNDRISSPKSKVASVAVSTSGEALTKARSSTTANVSARGRTRHLWGRLAPDENLTANWSEVLRTSAVSASSRPVDSKIQEEEDVAEASADVEAPMVSKQLVVDLQVRLEQALTRVEALEAKLEEQSSGLRGDLEDLRSRTKATEAKVEKVEAMPQGKIEASALPPLPDWSFPFPGGAFPDSSVRQPVANERVNPARATLHLRRPFDFEEFRRAQSQGLQNERLRVLVPPDQMSPLRKQ